jgi:glycine dehydrogenase
MLAIRAEIKAIEEGVLPRDKNPLKHAPHPASVVVASAWDRPYSREQAAFPTTHTKKHKYWPTVARVNNVHGDRHLVCSCPPPSEWAT